MHGVWFCDENLLRAGCDVWIEAVGTGNCPFPVLYTVNINIQDCQPYLIVMLHEFSAVYIRKLVTCICLNKCYAHVTEPVSTSLYTCTEAKKKPCKQ
jgi:hypothetical protein